MRKALLVIDVQNDFCEGGTLAVAGGNDVAKAIGYSLRDFAEIYHTIVTTQDWHINPGSHWSETPDFVDSWPKHCEAHTTGALLHAEISTRTIYIDEYFLKGEYKAAYSGFEGEGYLDPTANLHEYLIRNKITHVDIVGLALDYCVAATAKDAAERGYVTRVLLDKTAAVHSDPGTVLRTVRGLENAGVECV